MSDSSGWTIGDQVTQYEALTKNHLLSMGYLIKNGLAGKGEISANMVVFDERVKRITLLKTYNSNSPYNREDR